MKLSATIASLLIAMSMPLPVSAAIAPAPSASPSLQQAATPVVTVQHRRARTAHRRAVIPAQPDDGYGAYGAYGAYRPYGYPPYGGYGYPPYDGYGAYGAYGSYRPYNRMNSSGIYDWNDWSPTHHPGWPCIRGEESATSAYPSWEVGPGCRDD
jgi:hypothetical protein